MTAPAALPKPASTANRAAEKLRAFHEEENIAKGYDTRLLARLYPFLRPQARFFVASLASLAIVSALNLVRPLIMGNVVHKASLHDARGLLYDGILLSTFIVLIQLFTFGQTYATQVGGARAMHNLRTHIFLFLQRLELGYFDRTPVGRLVTRATSDVDALGEIFASGVLNAVGDLIQLVGIVVMMLVLDWRLSLIAFAAMPLVGVIVRVVRRRSREAFRDIRAKTARLNAFLNEQVSGIAIVQAYGRESAMAHEFDGINASYRDANKRSIYYEAVLDAAIEMISTLSIAGILWWAGIERLARHPVTFALLVTFTQYIKQFFEPVSLLAQRYMILQSGLSGAERIFTLLDVTQIDAPELSAAACAPDGPPDEVVDFDHVWFSYKPDVPVLKDVSLVVRRGEKIALVGATGAGKTTVASLALRLYEPQSGFVRILGKDVRRYDRHTLRENFSVVPQDVFLFSGSIASNVALSPQSGDTHKAPQSGDTHKAPQSGDTHKAPQSGDTHKAPQSGDTHKASDPNPDRAKVEEALARVGALDLFRARPDGIDARVDERGSNYSAGERQLIAFARALYRNAPIVVLDEATANIDPDTEARLLLAVSAVMEGRTSIVIAHRLSTIRSVDRIVVFHKGCIVEEGTHEELMRMRGVYDRLYRLQFAEERRRQAAPAAL